MSKSTRYTGPLPEVQKMVKGCKPEKENLIGMLHELEQIHEQIAVSERLVESLPQEIDRLLKSGRMDNAIIEELARKRVHLDLLPSRLEHLRQQQDTDRANHLQTTIDTIHEAACKYYEIQFQTAVKDQMKLGSDEDLAMRQARLRPEFNCMHPSFVAAQFSCCGLIERIRTILWCLEAFEAGIHPCCGDESEKIKQKWIPEI